MNGKILIVEDEFTIAMDIEQRLLAMGYEIVGIAVNYTEAIDLLKSETPDLALLDINLNEHKNGIDLANWISENYDFPILFLTAYTDESTFVSAAESNPMGYLSKPFKDNDLHHSIQLALRKARLQKSIDSTDLEEPELDKFNEAIFVKDKGQLKRVNIKDIIWAEAMDNYTLLHLKNEKLVAGAFLKDILMMLGPDFIRIHRSHAVAIDKITGIEDNLLFAGNICITISKSYKAALLKRLHMA